MAFRRVGITAGVGSGWAMPDAARRLLLGADGRAPGRRRAAGGRRTEHSVALARVLREPAVGAPPAAGPSPAPDSSPPSFGGCLPTADSSVVPDEEVKH